MDLLQEHFEFQQPLVQVDGRVRDVQKVSGYIFRRIWKNSGFVERNGRQQREPIPYICDFSRCGLNTRFICSYSNLAPRPQI